MKRLTLNANFIHLGQRQGLVDLRTRRGAEALLNCEVMRLDEFSVSTEAVNAVMEAATRVPGTVVIGELDDDGFAELLGACDVLR